MKKLLKNSIVIIAIALIVSTMLTSCGKSSIVGQWSNTANGVEIIGFTFTDEGEMSVSVAGVNTLKCDYKVEGDKLIYTVGGIETEADFSVDGNELTIEYLSTSYTLEKVK